MNIRILLTSGTVTSAAIVARRFPPDVIHQFIPYDLPRFVARFLDHWQPSFALFVESDLWPNLILSGAERRIPMIVINGRMSQRSFQRWRRASDNGGAARAVRDVPRAVADRRRPLLRARQPACVQHRQPETRRAGAAGRSREARQADGDDARPPGGRSPPRPIRARKRSCSTRIARWRFFPGAADRDRAAPSRSRQCDRAIVAGAGLRVALRSREELPAAPPTSTSPTRWASSACSIAWRRSCSWAARWSSTAARIRSRRSSSARRSCTARMWATSPTSTRRSTRPAARAAPTARKRWSSSSASCSTIPRRASAQVAARSGGRPARRRAGADHGGARALSAAAAAREGSVHA